MTVFGTGADTTHLQGVVHRSINGNDDDSQETVDLLRLESLDEARNYKAILRMVRRDRYVTDVYRTVMNYDTRFPRPSRQ